MCRAYAIANKAQEIEAVTVLGFTLICWQRVESLEKFHITSVVQRYDMRDRPHRELCMFQSNSSLQKPACVATSYQLWRSGLAMSRFGRRNDAWDASATQEQGG
ncbi:uncharacterized [Tachysurus ichikawai]